MKQDKPKDEGIYYTPREIIDAQRKAGFDAAISNPPFASPESARDTYIRTKQVMN